MEVIESNWKSTIFNQLKEQNQRRNVYDEIIEHCISICLLSIQTFISVFLFKIDNRILENNAILQIQCNKLQTDVHHLRLANAGLEKASEAR